MAGTKWRIVYFALLTVALLTAGAVAGSPITVETLVTLDALPQNGIVLAGLAPEPEGLSTLLEVAWERGASAWFPVWQLKLESSEGLLAGLGEVSVPQVTLEPGRTYRTTLSFDPQRGLLALRLADETTGEVLLRRGWRITPYEGMVYAAALPDAKVEGVFDWYQPADLRWEQGQMLEGGFILLQTLEPAEEHQVRVHAEGPLNGELRVLAGSQEGEVLVASGQWTGAQTFLSIPAASLPVGSVPLTLQYVEDGAVRYSETHVVQVGRVTGSVRAAYNRDAGTFDVTLPLTSVSELTDLELYVAATVSSLEWDPTARGYNHIPVGEWTELLDHVTVPTDGTQVTIQLPAPSEPGSWRIDLAATAEPNVVLHLLPPTAYVSTHEPVQFEEGETVTIAILPDTQLYAKFHPEIYMRMGEWLSEAAIAERIAFALHVGDITDDNARDQWQAARNAHGLMDGVVPYVLTVGNHDYAASGLVADRGTTLINEYWSVHDFPHLVGTMHEGRLENAFYELKAAGKSYLIVALEFAPSDEALAWANEVVAAHPDHTVIVVTHTYLHPSTERMASGRSAETFPLGSNPATTMNDGEDMWNKFVRKHPNIVFVVNGHIHSDAIPYRVSVGDHGNRVLQMLADFQAGPKGGEGYIVLVSFGDDGRVRARAYSPYLDAEKRGYDRHGNIVPVTILVGQ